MKVSVVLATLRRVGEVEAFIASLAAQSYRDFELIVVDQNPDDRLVEIITSYVESFDISHLRTDKRGLSRARNAGMEQARGEIVTFPDDDCLYPHGLLESVTGYFDANPLTDALTGRSVDGFGNTSNGRFHLEGGDVDKFNAWFRGIEYTTFVRRSRLGQVRFDERLGIGANTRYGAGEGVDFLMALIEDGACIHYEPNLTVIHETPYDRYDRKTFQKAYSYGVGMSFVIRRHKMPLSFKARWILRACGACVLALLRLDLPEAGYRFSILAGRTRGLMA